VSAVSPQKLPAWYQVRSSSTASRMARICRACSRSRARRRSARVDFGEGLDALPKVGLDELSRSGLTRVFSLGSMLLPRSCSSVRFCKAPRLVPRRFAFMSSSLRAAGRGLDPPRVRKRGQNGVHVEQEVFRPLEVGDKSGSHPSPNRFGMLAEDLRHLLSAYGCTAHFLSLHQSRGTATIIYA